MQCDNASAEAKREEMGTARRYSRVSGGSERPARYKRVRLNRPTPLTTCSGPDQSAGLHAIATAVPNEPGTFVAALYPPGSSLLVVSARHPSTERISRTGLRCISIGRSTLISRGTPTPQDKFFVQDADADGILSVLPGSDDVDVLTNMAYGRRRSMATRSRSISRPRITMPSSPRPTHAMRVS